MVRRGPKGGSILLMEKKVAILIWPPKQETKEKHHKTKKKKHGLESASGLLHGKISLRKRLLSLGPFAGERGEKHFPRKKERTC